MSAADDLAKAEWDDAKQQIENICHGGFFLDLQDVFERMAYHIEAWNKAQGFWRSDNKGEKYALMHSELSEGFEGVRKPGLSDKIGDQGFTIEEEELADLFIRLADYTGHFQLRLADAIRAKLLYNLKRPYMHGKTC